MVSKPLECVPAPTGKCLGREERSCREDREVYIRLKSWSYWWLCWGFKAIFRFDDLLKALRKAILFMIMVYCNEKDRIHIKVSIGERWIGRVQERPGTSFSVSSPGGVVQAELDSPSNDV